jgi:hypothetical protein
MTVISVALIQFPQKGRKSEIIRAIFDAAEFYFKFHRARHLRRPYNYW